MIGSGVAVIDFTPEANYATVAVEPSVEIPKPIVPPSPPTQPVVTKSPEPEPVAKPAEPVVIKPPEPVATPTPPKPIAIVAPATRAAPVIGDGSSPKPGSEPTTQEAQPGIRAKPNYLKNPEPPYPAMARRRRQEGLVLLSVRVSAQGRAVRVELKQSSGFPVLDEAALQAVRGWEFEPARLGAVGVESEIEVPVRFKLMN